MGKWTKTSQKKYKRSKTLWKQKFIWYMPFFLNLKQLKRLKKMVLESFILFFGAKEVLYYWATFLVRKTLIQKVYE